MLQKLKVKPGIILVLLALTSIYTCRISALETSAQAFVLMDAESGRVLLSQNAEQELPIASTTKIMTALVALERGNLSDRVSVKREHLREGSSMYLKEGEELTLEALLYGLLLSSGNDAAECIAANYGGEEFLRAMNEKAAALGMEHTAFSNASGLDAEGHHSSAFDMARLAAAAMNEPLFVRVVSTKSAVVGERTLANHNKLLATLEGCIGLKTGYTSAAGRTLVSCCERNGLRLVAVTLNDRADWDDHSALYDHAFSRYCAKAAVHRGDICAYLPLEGVDGKRVAVTAKESVFYPCAEGEEFSLKKQLPEALNGPIQTGDEVGELIVLVNGEEIGRTALVCSETIEENKAEEGFFTRLWHIISAEDQR